MIYCDDIVTDHCTLRSGGIWNGDGWDPDSSTNCTLFATEFETEDDSVAIKSGKNPEGILKMYNNPLVAPLLQPVSTDEDLQFQASEGFGIVNSSTFWEICPIVSVPSSPYWAASGISPAQRVYYNSKYSLIFLHNFCLLSAVLLMDLTYLQQLLLLIP